MTTQSNLKKNDLEDFYRGDVSDPQRLLVEEWLLSSKVALMEFFAIKRDYEVDLEEIPLGPKRRIYADLFEQVGKKKSAQIIPFQRKIIGRRSVAAAAAALLLLGAFMAQKEYFTTEDINTEFNPALSIDSSSEFLADSAYM